MNWGRLYWSKEDTPEDESQRLFKEIFGVLYSDQKWLDKWKACLAEKDKKQSGQALVNLLNEASGEVSN